MPVRYRDRPFRYRDRRFRWQPKSVTIDRNQRSRWSEIPTWLLCIHEPLIVEHLSAQLFGRRPDLPAWLYVLAGLAFLSIAGYGLWDRTQLKYYTLFVETSAGSSSLLQSRDKQGIEAIAQAIINVMENRQTAATYHVNVDQSKVTFGDEFSNIGSGASIANRSEIKH
ncbi:DUF6232 family protein [Janthinobacterium sp. CAN_S7]|uniref:DUF6232 family protein n=1 Tax=Janthinobacterium sp. CAN_S7 TaxID=3071704 RepID=UPI00319EA1BE